MNIVEALSDPDLFGALPAFRDLSTWRGWLAFLRAFYGLPMDAEDLELFRKYTGREVEREGGYPEGAVITGRQSGKTQVAGVVGSYEAAMSAQAGMWGAYVPLVAQDARGAQRTLLGYVRKVFDAPRLRREVVRDTADVIELRGGVALAVYPYRPQAVRGIRAPLVVVDERAFFTTTDGRPTDREMLRAVRPCLATTRGRLLILSSPYAQSGALWDLHRAHFGQDESSVLVWQASAPEMNPTLPADYVQRIELDDPEGYRLEVLGEFQAGLASLFDPDALEAVIASGRRELPAVSGVSYRAFVDPSGGRHDAFSLAIGHRSQGGPAVVDVLRAWRPPFNPSGVVEEAAALLKGYGVGQVTGDRYGGEWPREAFRRHDVAYEVAEADKSALYLAMLPAVNAADAELPDLLRELRGLERRRGTSGRDRVDHPRGGHDDRANAVAGLLWLLRRIVESATACSPSTTPVHADYRPMAKRPLLMFGRRLPS